MDSVYDVDDVAEQTIQVETVMTYPPSFPLEALKELFTSVLKVTLFEYS